MSEIFGLMTEVVEVTEDERLVKKIIFPKGIAAYCEDNEFEVLVVEDGEVWGYGYNSDEGTTIPFYEEEEPKPPPSPGDLVVTPFKKKKH